MAHRDLKNLVRRTASDKVLRDEAFNIAKNPKYGRFQRGLASIAYKFFDKKSSGSGIKSMPNQQLVDELYKSIAKKFKRKKVYSWFKDHICGAALASMQLITKYNKGIRFYLCVIDIFSTYKWVILLKDKKGITIANAFQKILNQKNKVKWNIGRQKKWVS